MITQELAQQLADLQSRIDKESEVGFAARMVMMPLNVGGWDGPSMADFQHQQSADVKRTIRELTAQRDALLEQAGVSVEKWLTAWKNATSK